MNDDDERTYFTTWHVATYGAVEPETVAERLAEFRKELEAIG